MDVTCTVYCLISVGRLGDCVMSLLQFFCKLAIKNVDLFNFY